jgi:multidrug transporter EmrE-like cation transporter
LSTTATLPAKQQDAASRRKSIILVCACTILGTLAQVLMKTGMDHFKLEPMALLTNLPLVAGYVLYGVNTVMLVMALREGELSVLYPILALTYVWVTLVSYIRLHEPPNIYKNLGVMAIIAGVIVISRGSREVNR